MAYINMHFYSLSLMKMTECVVLMPDGLKEGEKVPVLYLLHGFSDDCTAWTRRTSLERYLGTEKLCVIMPSGYTSWYIDGAFGKFFTYITDELPRLMHAYFPQLSSEREDNYIAGLSMGGYGAMKAALTYPERYSFCGALSASFDLKKRISTHATVKAACGDEKEFVGSRNDLFAVAERAKDKDLPRLYIPCGTEDELCLDDNISFKAHLDALGIKYESVSDSGTHSWNYWDKHIIQVLVRIQKK